MTTKKRTAQKSDSYAMRQAHGAIDVLQDAIDDAIDILQTAREYLHDYGPKKYRRKT